MQQGRGREYLGFEGGVCGESLIHRTTAAVRGVEMVRARRSETTS
jgi:hypothetical protein